MRKTYFTTDGTEEIYQAILQDPSFEFLRRWNSSDTHLLCSVPDSEISKACPL